jgi:hypothetical protein
MSSKNAPTVLGMYPELHAKDSRMDSENASTNFQNAQKKSCEALRMVSRLEHSQREPTRVLRMNVEWM